MPACKVCTRNFSRINKIGLCAECSGEVTVWESDHVKIVIDKRGRVRRVERKKERPSSANPRIRRWG